MASFIEFQYLGSHKNILTDSLSAKDPPSQPNPTFIMINLEVPGEPVSGKVTEQLLRVLQKLFEANTPDFIFNPKKFIGSHPVSFSREHFAESQDYLVCEKSDGVRYLLFLPEIPNIRGVNECQGFLIDRKNLFWKINVLIPASILKGHSLFDVELVLDHETDRRLLVFDTLFINSICD